MFPRISLLISRCDRVKWNGFTCRFQQICTGILIITLNILKKVLGCLNSSWNQLKASVFILQASFYIWHICPSIQEHSGDEKSRSERPTNVAHYNLLNSNSTISWRRNRGVCFSFNQPATAFSQRQPHEGNACQVKDLTSESVISYISQSDVAANLSVLYSYSCCVN